MGLRMDPTILKTSAQAQQSNLGYRAKCRIPGAKTGDTPRDWRFGAT